MHRACELNFLTRTVTLCVFRSWVASRQFYILTRVWWLPVRGSETVTEGMTCCCRWHPYRKNWKRMAGHDSQSEARLMTSSSVTPARQTHHNEPSVLACSSAITALHCGLLQICPLRVYISLEYAIRIGGRAFTSVPLDQRSQCRYLPGRTGGNCSAGERVMPFFLRDRWTLAASA